jgi:hypothetical protein
VQGGVVRDVVEEAAEDLVVAHFVKGASLCQLKFKGSSTCGKGDLRH